MRMTLRVMRDYSQKYVPRSRMQEKRSQLGSNIVGSISDSSNGLQIIYLNLVPRGLVFLVITKKYPFVMVP